MSDQFSSVPPALTQAPAPAGDKKGLAIASMILGILSWCASIFWFCGGPISVVGIVLGFLGMKSSGRKMAIAGIILSAIGLLLMIVFIIISLVSGPIIGNIFNQINSSLLKP
jgi:hypothetical protein